MIIEADVDLEHLFNMAQTSEEEVDVLDSMNHNPEVYDEEFAYMRTLSRLREMQTQEYQELSVRASSAINEQ